VIDDDSASDSDEVELTAVQMWGQHYDNSTWTVRDTLDVWADGIWTHKHIRAVFILSL